MTTNRTVMGTITAQMEELAEQQATCKRNLVEAKQRLEGEAQYHEHLVILAEWQESIRARAEQLSYLEKRRILYLLGVCAYVKRGRRGVKWDFDRVEVQFAWEGLNSLLRPDIMLQQPRRSAILSCRPVASSC